jgi:hypothetical protein
MELSGTGLTLDYQAATDHAEALRKLHKQPIRIRLIQAHT